MAAERMEKFKKDTFSCNLSFRLAVIISNILVLKQNFNAENK